MLDIIERFGGVCGISILAPLLPAARAVAWEFRCECEVIRVGVKLLKAVSGPRDKIDHVGFVLWLLVVFFGLLGGYFGSSRVLRILLGGRGSPAAYHTIPNGVLSNARASAFWEMVFIRFH